MSQSIMEHLFRDDPFFEDAFLLWPRSCSLAERFLGHQEQMMETFGVDVGDRLINKLFQNLDELFSTPPSSISADSLTGPSAFSLDTRGFSPEDIAVTVCGRKLEVKVAKPTDADPSSPAGFSRSIELPEHIKPSTLSCRLGDDGYLKIESRDKEAEADERPVQLRFRTSLDFPLNSTSETEEKNN